MSSAALKRTGSAQQEATTAKALQAAHQILTKLEASKLSSEDILDTLPDLFIICSEYGRVVKGNHEAARLLGVDHEELLGQNFFDLFKNEAKNIIKKRFKSVGDGEEDTITFELPMQSQDTEDNSTLEYVWTLGEFTQVSRRRGKFVKVIGKDITDIRKMEKKLSSIFAAIPLGIVTCGSSGAIEEPYSSYTEILLNETNLRGKNIVEVLFEPVMDSFDATTKTGISQLLGTIGEDTVWFDLSKSYFPSIMETKDDSGEEKWVGIYYHPITKDGIVNQLMLVLEDRTEAIKAQREADIERRVQSGRLKKILEIQNCSGALLEVTFEDLEIQMPALEKQIDESNYEAAPKTLHAIKGIVRTAGFTDMMELSHEMEEHILHSDEISNDWLKESLDDLRNQWKSLKGIGFALSGRSFEVSMDRQTVTTVTRRLQVLRDKVGQDDQGIIDEVLHHIGIDSLEDTKSLTGIASRLEHQAASLREKLGKDFELSVDLPDIQVPNNDFAKYNEIFLHLFTNGADHGIEDAEKRETTGKPATATIAITHERKGDYTYFTVKDDGGGIPKKRVLEKALSQGIISNEESKVLTDKEIFGFLLKPSFSTKSEANEVSGRGIGLDAVNAAIKELGSSGLDISSEEGKGTTFCFKIKI